MKPGEFWANEAAEYCRLSGESHKAYLNAFIWRKIEELAPKRVLDFGCGDGTLFSGRNVDYQSLWLFDPSKRMIALAQSLLRGLPFARFSTDFHNLPEAHFDLIVCSLVLMTISRREQLEQCAETMAKALRPDGRCLVAVTHPCFRGEEFSTFKTEFGSGRAFKYVEDGIPFKVTLRDPETGGGVEFTDYHWSLGSTATIFFRSGLVMDGLYEVADEAEQNGSYNHNVPGYLVLRFRCT